MSVFNVSTSLYRQTIEYSVVFKHQAHNETNNKTENERTSVTYIKNDRQSSAFSIRTPLDSFDEDKKKWHRAHRDAVTKKQKGQDYDDILYQATAIVKKKNQIKWKNGKIIVFLSNIRLFCFLSVRSFLCSFLVQPHFFMPLSS